MGVQGMTDERFDIDVGYNDPQDPRDDVPVDKPSPAEYEEERPRLFEAPADWEEHWAGMPEFEMKESSLHSSVQISFETKGAREEFFKRLGMRDHARRYNLRYPPPRAGRDRNKCATGGLSAGRYPIYVISKGRWESRQTSRALEALGVSYLIVIEPQERERYAEHINSDRILTLPFSNLGQGSIPARNWVWEHAASTGARRHWILDDNIEHFARLNQNNRHKIVDENPFVPCEDFVDRYQNVALAGMQYRTFVSDNATFKPFTLNTRIYSCTLIDNQLPLRWRGRYNEDTDLSLRVLKAGYCTVLFNAYLIGKAATMTMAGGNTDELYADDGRLRMAEALREQHPNLVTVGERWGRAQHVVDYSPFRFNKLKEVSSEDVRVSLLPEDGRPGRGDDGPPDCRLGTEGNGSEASERVRHSDEGMDELRMDL